MVIAVHTPRGNKRRGSHPFILLEGPPRFPERAFVLLQSDCLRSFCRSRPRSFFSVMTDLPLTGKPWAFTLGNYAAFFSQNLYLTLLPASLRLGLEVTGYRRLADRSRALARPRGCAGQTLKVIVQNTGADRLVEGQDVVLRWSPESTVLIAAAG